MAAGYATALAVLVLSPIGDQLGDLTLRCWRLWNDDLRLPGHPPPSVFGFALNVVLFVPVGALALALLRRPWWVAGLVCVALSALIETAQLLPALHRDSSLADVAANGLGGFLGALAWTVLTPWSRREGGAPRRR